MIRTLLLAAAALLAPLPIHAATLVTAARYLDVDTGRYVDNPAILVGNDGRIQQIGSIASIQVPDGTKHVVDSGIRFANGLRCNTSPRSSSRNFAAFWIR